MIHVTRISLTIFFVIKIGGGGESERRRGRGGAGLVICSHLVLNCLNYVQGIFQDYIAWILSDEKYEWITLHKTDH